jgi:catechol 2,3-dioxygenase-like lactoylglutathione lyase family enzyme
MPVEFQRLAPVLPVRDVEAALAHYRALGFEGDAYGERSQGRAIYGFLRRGPVELHLALVAELDPAANTSAVYLYVDDANALYDSWSTAGVAGRFDAPVDTPYGLRELAHVDPDGNLLRVGSELG